MRIKFINLILIKHNNLYSSSSKNVLSNLFILIFYLFDFFNICKTSSSSNSCVSPTICGEYLTDFPQTIADLNESNISLCICFIAAIIENPPLFFLKTIGSLKSGGCPF